MDKKLSESLIIDDKCNLETPSDTIQDPKKTDNSVFAWQLNSDFIENTDHSGFFHDNEYIKENKTVKNTMNKRRKTKEATGLIGFKDAYVEEANSFDQSGTNFSEEIQLKKSKEIDKNYVDIEE